MCLCFQFLCFSSQSFREYKTVRLVSNAEFQCLRDDRQDGQATFDRSQCTPPTPAAPMPPPSNQNMYTPSATKGLFYGVHLPVLYVTNVFGVFICSLPLLADFRKS